MKLVAAMAGNFFVPGGGAPAAWGAQEQAEVNVQMAGNNGARAGRYAANQAPMAAGDRQDFDGTPLLQVHCPPSFYQCYCESLLDCVVECVK